MEEPAFPAKALTWKMSMLSLTEETAKAYIMKKKAKKLQDLELAKQLMEAKKTWRE